MKRRVPFLLLTAALFVMWVLLTGFSPGHVLLGAVVALLVSRVMLMLGPERVRIRFGPAIVKLAALVVAAHVRSTIAVPRVGLFRQPEQPTRIGEKRGETRGRENVW